MTDKEQLEQAITAQENLRGTLDDAIIDATIAALQKQLADLEAASEPQRRKLVTILFMDVVGSTEMTRALDAEDNLAIMETALQRLSAPVEEHGGRVTRYMGDGFLAIFGLPLANENDPEMAVRAGLGILAEAEGYAGEVEQQWHVPGFSVRVGIDTGLVVTGGRSEGEDTISGSTVNLASRLESAALPGTLLISRHTYQHIRGVFDFQPQEPVQAKGFPEPVQVYQVLGAKERSFRTRRRGVEGIETPMVGRQGEMKALHDGYYAAVEDGERQVVTIIGEAGLGKSRLLYEFENWVDLQPGEMALYRGRARLETRRLPYSLLRDLFAFHFAIQDDDPAQTVREKFASGFVEMLGSGETTEMKTHFVGQFLGYDFGASPHLAEAKDDPQQIWDRAQTYITEYFRAASNRQTALILFEDMHWADDGSLDVIARLGLALSEQPALLVCAARPSLYQRRPHWFEGQSFHRRLDLQPLSKRDSRQLVEEVLQKVEKVPDSLRELVVSSAEGNPFYVEELIKMLIEEGVIVKGEERWQVQLDRLPAVQVPPTLTGVLQARLDSLPEEERLVLQQASVIGRVFWDAMIAYLNQSEAGGLAEETARQGLEALREREMVYRREVSAFVDAVELIFKHNILREVTYETVLKAARRAYHALAADWLLQHSSERVDEIPQIIAYHLEQAGKKKEALKYLTLAGDQAAASYANEEAIDHYSHALMLAGQTKASGEVVTNLYTQLGRVLELNDQYSEALNNYEQMERAARDRDDQTMLLSALMARFTLHAIVSPTRDPQRAEAILEQALALAIEMADEAAEAKILWNSLNLYRHTNRLGEAINCGERSLTLALKLNLQEQTAYTLNDLAHCYEETGHFDKAKKLYREAAVYWKQLNNRPMLADNLSSMVYLLRFAGEYEEALAASGEAYDICQSIGNIRGQSYSLYTVGTIYWDRGEVDQALDTMEECRRLGKLSDFFVPELFTRADMASLYGGLGETSKGLKMAHQALAVAESELPAYRGGPLIALTELHLTEGNLVEAEAALEQAQGEPMRDGNALYDVQLLLTECLFSLARGDYSQCLALTEELVAKSVDYGMGYFKPEALFLGGQAYEALGQSDLAQEQILKARAAAEAIGSRRLLWQILFGLSQLEDDPAVAQQLHQQAREIIGSISERIDRPELRESFLNQPQVQAVLEPLV
jgi:predicted ATPase/class 3 adenylate cyclase